MACLLDSRFRITSHYDYNSFIALVDLELCMAHLLLVELCMAYLLLVELCMTHLLLVKLCMADLLLVEMCMAHLLLVDKLMLLGCTSNFVVENIWQMQLHEEFNFVRLSSISEVSGNLICFGMLIFYSIRGIFRTLSETECFAKIVYRFEL